MTTPIILKILYTPFLLWIAITDWREHRIPNVLIVPLISVALIVSLINNTRNAMIGGLVGITIFLIPVFLYGPKRAGMGDVKYGLFVGLAIGWPYVIFTFFITFILALIYVMIGLISKRITKETSIPLAPFITTGILVDFWLF